MTRNSFKSVLTITAVVLLLGACSASSKGKKGDGDGLSESDLNANREARFGEGGIPTAEANGMFRDVHFAYDSSSIDDSAMQNIEFNAEVLKQNEAVKIQLEGHCDERGTAEYNLSLGQERAKSVRDALASLGVPTSKLDMISYGEEVPLVPGQDEGAYAQNRRVHLSPFSGSASGSSAKAGGAAANPDRF